jgi:transketolase
VVIVGTGSGLSYSELGPTHHSLEDMAILRTLPGMRVLAPCDASELRQALHEVLKDDSPTYIRIGKKGEADIHPFLPDLKLGKVLVIRPGTDVALLCAGNMMADTLKAADLLAVSGISAEVVSFHTVKPLDADYLQQAASRFKLLVTVEEHSRIGGFGSAVAEWRMAQPRNVAQLGFGTDDVFMHEVGSQAYARKKYGLTADNIAATTLAALRA